MSPKKNIISKQVACNKCLKKYGEELIDWEACKNCQWVSTENIVEVKSEEETQKEKIQIICLACNKKLRFIEIEPGKFICGKNNCIRDYLETQIKKK